MAECSQEFESLLIKHEEECFDDWVLNTRSPECASAKEAILQYVARLEAIRDKVREVAGPLAADMVGGYAVMQHFEIFLLTDGRRLLMEHTPHGHPGSPWSGMEWRATLP